MEIAGGVGLEIDEFMDEGGERFVAGIDRDVVLAQFVKGCCIFHGVMGLEFGCKSRGKRLKIGAGVSLLLFNSLIMNKIRRYNIQYMKSIIETSCKKKTLR